MTRDERLAEVFPASPTPLPTLSCECAYCTTARTQLEDARDLQARADKALARALDAWGCSWT